MNVAEKSTIKDVCATLQILEHNLTECATNLDIMVQPSNKNATPQTLNGHTVASPVSTDPTELQASSDHYVQS